jgi:hypothetical protein
VLVLTGQQRRGHRRSSSAQGSKSDGSDDEGRSSDSDDVPYGIESREKRGFKQNREDDSMGRRTFFTGDLADEWEDDLMGEVEEEEEEKYTEDVSRTQGSDRDEAVLLHSQDALYLPGLPHSHPHTDTLHATFTAPTRGLHAASTRPPCGTHAPFTGLTFSSSVLVPALYR